MFKQVFKHHGVIAWKTGEMMPDSASPSLQDCLKDAINSISTQLEEEGGVILKKDIEFKFVKIRNINTGSSKAYGLYEVDRSEYGAKIIPLFNTGWVNYATFHTHPQYCHPYPSITDLTRLFKSAPVNFIYSDYYDQLCGYTVNSMPTGLEKIHWDGYDIIL